MLNIIDYSVPFSCSVVSDSLQPHRQQTTRLPHPWDSPGKNTGVGCHFLLHCMKVKSESEVAQSCPTLCDPMNCSTPGLPVHHQLPESTQTHVHIYVYPFICEPPSPHHPTLLSHHRPPGWAPHVV